MNYLKELNAFYHKMIFQPLSGSAVSLWNTLMNFNNRCFWQKEFSVPASVLQTVSGVKGGSFSRAREELVSNGFIRVTSRGANKAAMYQMISQIQEVAGGAGMKAESQLANDDTSEDTDNRAEMKPVIHPGDELVDDSVVNCTAGQVAGNKDDNIDNSTAGYTDDKAARSKDGNPVPLFKQKENKRQNETRQKQQPIHHFDVLSFYQENFGMVGAYVQSDMLYWVEKSGEEMVLYAMKRSLEQNKPTWGYVKGILHTWSARGIMTVQQAKDDDAAFRNRSRMGQNGWQKASAEVVPDWFHKRKQQGKRRDGRKSPVPDPEVTPEADAELAALLAEFRGNGEVSG